MWYIGIHVAQIQGKIRKDYIYANLVDGAKKGDKAYAGSWLQAPVAEGESISSMTMHKFKNCDWIMLGRRYFHPFSKFIQNKFVNVTDQYQTKHIITEKIL